MKDSKAYNIHFRTSEATKSQFVSCSFQGYIIYDSTLSETKLLKHTSTKTCTEYIGKH